MIDPLTSVIAAVVLIWFLGLRLLPVTLWRKTVKDGANAKNWPGLILMREGVPVPGAVWAQELYEARLAWRWLPVHTVLMLAGRAVPRFAAWERSFELMGHEVEVWAEAALLTNRLPAHMIRAREAHALVQRYGAFKGWTVFRVEAEMERRSAKARKFVTRHHRRIESMHTKGKAR